MAMTQQKALSKIFGDPQKKILKRLHKQIDAKAFSAGGDIGYFYELIEAGDSVNIDDLNVKVDQIAVAIKKSSKMMIASVSGAAAGAGASLALAADFIVCADNAKFIMAFVNLGLVPDTGGAYLLARQLGEKRGREIGRASCRERV